MNNRREELLGHKEWNTTQLQEWTCCSHGQQHSDGGQEDRSMHWTVSFYLVFNCKGQVNQTSGTELRLPLGCLHPIPGYLGSSPGSSPDCRLQLMHTLGVTGDGSSNWVPATPVRDPDWVLGFWLQPDTIPILHGQLGSWPGDGSSLCLVSQKLKMN